MNDSDIVIIASEAAGTMKLAESFACMGDVEVRLRFLGADRWLLEVWVL